MEAAQQDRGAQTRAISDGAVQLLRDYTGRGPTKARAMFGEDIITVLLTDTLTKSEHKLVEFGEAKRVLDTRKEVQRMMRDELVALVESVVQRKVIAFMSDNHIEPDLAVEMFVLAPQD